jgi:hypothetical protein
MGFAPAEVATGVGELLASRGFSARAEEQTGERWIFHAGGVVITVGPLPAERQSAALFHPRALLVLHGDGAFAEELKTAIRLKFLRVTG